MAVKKPGKANPKIQAIPMRILSAKSAKKVKGGADSKIVPNYKLTAAWPKK